MPDENWCCCCNTDMESKVEVCKECSMPFCEDCLETHQGLIQAEKRQKEILTTYLEALKSKGVIHDYRVKDGKCYVVPKPPAEEIELDFTVLEQGEGFSVETCSWCKEGYERFKAESGIGSVYHKPHGEHGLSEVCSVQ